MKTAKKILESKRICGKNELYTVVYCEFQLEGTSNLSPRARRYLYFLISLVRQGYTRIAAPMAIIADAIYRAQGQTSSVRTLRSALAELETAGFLTRLRCRIGRANAHAVIELHLERFVFWTKISHKNILPLNTYPHKSLQRQVLPGDDLRSNNSRVNSLNNCVTSIQEPRARTRSKKSAKKHFYHPIIYTLLCIIINTPKKWKMIELAQKEIAEEIEPETGIDWRYFESIWPALDPKPGGRRENTAKCEILPNLSATIDNIDSSSSSSSSSANPPFSSCSIPFSSSSSPHASSSPPPSSSSSPHASSSEIKKIIDNFFELRKKESKKKKKKEISLSREDLAILSAAKQSVKYRR